MKNYDERVARYDAQRRHGRKKRKARERAAGPRITKEEWHALVMLYERRCVCCLHEAGEVYERWRNNITTCMLVPDHVVALARGGTNDIQNIQPLCHECNTQKSTRTIDYRADFWQRIALHVNGG